MKPFVCDHDSFASFRPFHLGNLDFRRDDLHFTSFILCVNGCCGVFTLDKWHVHQGVVRGTTFYYKTLTLADSKSSSTVNQSTNVVSRGYFIGTSCRTKENKFASSSISAVILESIRLIPSFTLGRTQSLHTACGLFAPLSSIEKYWIRIVMFLLSSFPCPESLCHLWLHLMLLFACLLKFHALSFLLFAKQCFLFVAGCLVLLLLSLLLHPRARVERVRCYCLPLSCFSLFLSLSLLLLLLSSLVFHIACRTKGIFLIRLRSFHSFQLAFFYTCAYMPSCCWW